MYQKLWHHRLKRRKEYPFVEDFNASIKFDRRLVDEEITGSLVYARALGKAGILTPRESSALVKTLRAVRAKTKSGRFSLDGSEDIHTAIEAALTRRLGNSGRKIHTGRSRNEQVVLDERLYLKKGIAEISRELLGLEKVILRQSEKHLGLVMPGYTHLQQAQPILFSHYLMALFFMLERDKERLGDCLRRVNVCPLGSGALAGSTPKIDRSFVAKELGFGEISKNSLDATSDRDFIVEFISAAAILMMHLSRFSEDLILWSSQEFGFIELSDSLTTSSSLMPHKKNPDSLELIRGKSGRVFGHLVGLLTVLKGLPMGYNKDMQEDKTPLFDTVDTAKASLKVFSLAVKTMIPKPDKMRTAINDNAFSSDLADYLVGKGIPFRQSHGLVGKVVRYSLDKKKPLRKLALTELKKFSPKFEKDVFQIWDIRKSIAAHDLPGGTSERMVKRQIKAGWGCVNNTEL